MTRKPWALDLFCGAGGAARGLMRAGFRVHGVDILDQPSYPLGATFEQHDVLKIRNVGEIRKLFDFVWASPPCQAHTALKTAPNAKEHEDLIPATRELLLKIGLPYVIENVPGAPLIEPITLCGSHFGLGVRANGRRYELRRHRLFECSFPIDEIGCAHKHPVIGIYGGHVRSRAKSAGGRRTKDFEGCVKPQLAAEAMDIAPFALTMNELSQAIPPAYADYIGRAFLEWRKTQ